MRLVRPSLLLACLVLMCGSAASDEDAPPRTLAVGDTAPALDMAHYVTGQGLNDDGSVHTITSFEPGHIYVLVFWGTWCEPSWMNLPRLGALQDKHAARGLTIIGVSDEPLSHVVGFLMRRLGDGDAGTGDPYGLLLTADPDGSTHKDYYAAAGLDGMPAAFVIGKQGRVEWIGHPLGVGPIVERMLAGRWDRDEYAQAGKLAKQRALKRKVLQGMLDQAEEAGDWGRYLGLLDGALTQDPGAIGLALLRFQHHLFRGTDLKRAYVLGSALLQRTWDDAQMLNEIAWSVLEDVPPERRNATFALKAAIRANELTASTDAAILDTLARAHFERGAVALAIKWQELAVARSAEDEGLSASLRETLARYRKVAAGSTKPGKQGKTR